MIRYFYSRKIMLLAVLLGSLTGYLSWGTNSKAWLLITEGEVIIKLFTNPKSVVHPFIVLPMLGQACLLLAMFQKQPNKWLIVTGVVGIGMLYLFISFIGILQSNLLIFISTLPFIMASSWLIYLSLKQKFT